MKKISKVAIFAVCMMAVLGSSFSTYATNVSKSEQKKERSNVEKNQDFDMVIGKITSIDANNVTIEVATRKKREKKSADAAGSQNERQKPENEDRFTLTGESKTYNISSANFGKKTAANGDSKNAEKMTYTDYKVGDYVRIAVSKENPTIAKRMRQVNEGANFNKVKGNYKGGYKGSYTGKTKAEKAAE